MSKPQHTEYVNAGNRIYFFDVHEDKKGNQYIAISELMKFNQKRTCVFLHKENMDDFIEALNKSIDYINNGTEDPV